MTKRRRKGKRRRKPEWLIPRAVKKETVTCLKLILSSTQSWAQSRKNAWTIRSPKGLITNSGIRMKSAIGHEQRIQFPCHSTSEVTLETSLSWNSLSATFSTQSSRSSLVQGGESAVKANDLICRESCFVTNFLYLLVAKQNRSLRTHPGRFWFFFLGFRYFFSVDLKVVYVVVGCCLGRRKMRVRLAIDANRKVANALVLWECDSASSKNNTTKFVVKRVFFFNRWVVRFAQMSTITKWLCTKLRTELGSAGDKFIRND